MTVVADRSLTIAGFGSAHPVPLPRQAATAHRVAYAGHSPASASSPARPPGPRTGPSARSGVDPHPSRRLPRRDPIARRLALCRADADRRDPRRSLGRGPDALRLAGNRAGVNQPALRRPASHRWWALHSISVTWPDGRGRSSYLRLIGRRRATSPRVRVVRAAIVAAAAAPSRHLPTAASHSVKKDRPGSSKYGTSTPRPPPQWVIEPSTRACTSKLSTTRAAQPATAMAARRRWRQDVPSHRQTQSRMRTTDG